MPDLEEKWREQSEEELLYTAMNVAENAKKTGSALNAEIKSRCQQEPIATIREEDHLTGEVIGIGNRYRDAYLFSKTVTSLGRLVKTVGVIIAILITIIGAVFGTIMAIIPAALIGFMVGFVFWVGGVLVSALGQFTLTTVDVAVNTSPFGGNTEKARIMGIKMPQKNPTVD